MSSPTDSEDHESNSSSANARPDDLPALTDQVLQSEDQRPPEDGLKLEDLPNDSHPAAVPVITPAAEPSEVLIDQSP